MVNIMFLSYTWNRFLWGEQTQIPVPPVQGSFLLTLMDLFPVWISNCVHYTFWWNYISIPNLSGTAFEAGERISNLIPHFTEHVNSIHVGIRLICISKSGRDHYPGSDFATEMLYCMYWHIDKLPNMMKSSHGNIFRVTGHLWGKFTGYRWISYTKPVTRNFDVSFDRPE